MIARIKRQKGPEEPPYYQSFLFETRRGLTVAGLLEEINGREKLCDADGAEAEPVCWECGCLQGQCGACAMVIDKTPALACRVFLDGFKKETVTIRPLSRFPVVADLVVDREILYENLRQAQVWTDRMAERKKKLAVSQHSAATCLKCGLCMEVCPNYRRGEQFYGPGMLAETYLAYTQEEREIRKKEMLLEYRDHFAAGCSKSLACRSVCPVHVDLITAIASMNHERR